MEYNREGPKILSQYDNTNISNATNAVDHGSSNYDHDHDYDHDHEIVDQRTRKVSITMVTLLL